MTASNGSFEPIAVVGLAVRAPSAANADEFWRNILGKVESVRRFDKAELTAAGIPAGLVADPSYVPAACILDDADQFEPEFFGLSPSEAATMDPQHRLFLEVAAEALEDAGHDPRRFPGAIGVYGGAYMNKYLPINLYTNDAFIRSPAAYFARNYNDKDFMTGHVAYRLDLRGPAITVQTACSTSLVATHLACRALQARECDMALVGGVAVNVPLKSGYMALEGTMYAPTGRCRPFDAEAQGTIPGNGAVVLTLRRLSDALADGDTIRAVIRGTAINNDGAAKMSFTAPNPEAQTRLIASAQLVAGVDPATIGYVEAHGTGTILGDPIEVAALTAAFRLKTENVGFCALGSVKANIGHLDAGAGAAGLARAVLALHRGWVPPQAGFERPNPELNLETSPFYVPTEASPWPRGEVPRRAAVSAFAVGGTNAHVVLEEAPAPLSRPQPTRSHHLIALSARTREALELGSRALADAVTAENAPDLADVSFTLAVGRTVRPMRRAIVAADAQDAATRLRSQGSVVAAKGTPRVVFMFPGVGTQYPDMGLGLYETEPVFRDEVDRCASILGPRLGMDIRAYLFPLRYDGGPADRESVPHALAAILTIEIALARLWMAWGVKPDAMLGHSLGEYAAAAIAGVLSVEDALDLTVRRGRIFERIPEGRMMAANLPADEIMTVAGNTVSLGAVNARDLSLVSGRVADLEALKEKLSKRGFEARILPVRMASHSFLVDPYLAEFESIVGSYALAEPTIPFLSCFTGKWIGGREEAMSPSYWARQLRGTVQFAAMLGEVLSTPGTILLEVGPGTTLCSLAAAQKLEERPLAVASLRRPSETVDDRARLLEAAGRLWEAGALSDITALSGVSAPQRVPLPTTPFWRRPFWISQGRAIGPGSSSADPLPAPEIPAYDVASSVDRPIASTEAEWTLRERKIAAIWRDLLGVKEIGLDDDFESLGGNSLMAAQMLRQLRPLSTAPFRIADLFGAPSIRKLAALIEDRETAGGREGQSAAKLEAEAVLDDAIRGIGTAPVGKEIEHIFLTGATGYLGTYLLAELLHRTRARIYCLVRAASPADGFARLSARLASFALPLPDRNRLRAVVGDLQEQRFGMSETAFAALAGTVDAVVHCGAWVNFARPYDVLKRANVGGTEEVLRLASTGKPKSVHHVSTIYVAMGAIVEGVARFDEDDSLPPPVGHDTGYTESKWVAERICEIAVERGISVTIHRPGNILPHSTTGRANSEDYYTKLIQGCVRLGSAPRRDFRLPVATVDDVARAIVAALTIDEKIGRRHHVIQPEPSAWDIWFDQLRRFGYDVPSIPWDKWRTRLEARLAAGDDSVLAPLADLLGNVPENRKMPVFGVANSSALRRAAGFTFTALDNAYFARIFDSLIGTGLLPAVVNRSARVHSPTAAE